MRVKSLIKKANPVPGAAHAGLSPRAAEELAALTGTARDAPAPTARRSPRWGVLTAAGACGAAVVIGGAALFGLQDDPAGPSGNAAAPSSTSTGRGEGGDDGIVVDEPYYDSTSELEGAAHVIVRARLGPGREETADGVRTTVATATVVAAAKGGTPGEEIRLSYTTPGTGPETPGLTAGREYVLLLTAGGGGHHLLVNSTQGWYAIEDGEEVAGRDNDVPLGPDVRKALRLAPRAG